MKISRELLTNLVGLSRQAFPREVGGILLVGEKGKDKAIIDDFVLTPGQFYEDSVVVHLENIPIYANATGSFHSHPRGIPLPSKADKDFFSRTGKVHLIIAVPSNDVGVFDGKGKPLKLDVV